MYTSERLLKAMLAARQRPTCTVRRAVPSSASAGHPAVAAGCEDRTASIAYGSCISILGQAAALHTPMVARPHHKDAAPLSLQRVHVRLPPAQQQHQRGHGEEAKGRVAAGEEQGEGKTGVPQRPPAVAGRGAAGAGRERERRRGRHVLRRGPCAAPEAAGEAHLLSMFRLELRRKKSGTMYTAAGSPARPRRAPSALPPPRPCIRALPAAAGRVGRKEVSSATGLASAWATFCDLGADGQEVGTREVTCVCHSNANAWDMLGGRNETKPTRALSSRVQACVLSFLRSKTVPAPALLCRPTTPTSQSLFLAP